MNFFEYLFCRLYWWNTQIIKEKEIPIFYSTTGLSVFQGFTIIPLYSVMKVWITESFLIGEIFGLSPFLIIGIIIFTIDFFYFSKKRHAKLYHQFNKMKKQEKKKKDILCISYIIVIIVVNVLFFIYFRAQNIK
jgi:hypothetical protein